MVTDVIQHACNNINEDKHAEEIAKVWGHHRVLSLQLDPTKSSEEREL